MTQHLKTPWLPKCLCIFVVAYALSPIDLIPDFIPVLGFLDDAILLPVLIWGTLKMIPAEVIAESSLKSQQWWAIHEIKPKSNLGLVIVMWVVFAAFFFSYLQT